MKKSLFRVLSGISGNLSAGWLGLIFIAPGFVTFDSVTLTKSLSFAIFSMILAIAFDRFPQ